MEVRADEIEADFQHYYGIHLGDLFTGDLTLRRFAALLYGLPPGCATWRMQGGELAWTDETRAALMTRHAVETLQSSFSKKPREIPIPKPPEWGHLEKAQESESLVDQLDAKIKRMSARKKKN